jgi:hypothetical protein
MDTAAEAADEALRDALKDVGKAHGASAVRYALDINIATEYLEPISTPSLEDDQLYLGLEADAEARADELAPTGSINPYGSVEFPEQPEPDEPGGGGLTMAAGT